MSSSLENIYIFMTFMKPFFVQNFSIGFKTAACIMFIESVIFLIHVFMIGCNMRCNMVLHGKSTYWLFCLQKRYSIK